MRKIGLALLCSVLWGVVDAEEASVPVVPPSVLSAGKGESTRLSFVDSGKKDGDSSGSSPRILRARADPLVVPVKPGINVLLPIAVGHYNRVVTPFDSPYVQTVSDAVIEPHGNVLYVASDSEFPVTLFITPDVDDESHAISLTLQPSSIPPIEARLVIEGSESGVYFSKKKAKKYEEGQPYTESIKSILRDLANGQVPDGYSLDAMKAGDMLPRCLQGGMEYDFVNGQYLRGHHFHVAVGTVKNVAKHLQEVDETACIDGQIAAVAVWPEAYMKPGGKSEIFVLMRHDLNPVEAPTRRSLLEDPK